MKIFRRVLFWLHLCLGVTGGLVIFIMCVTGASLAFEKNILECLERDQRYVAAGTERLSTEQILAKVVEVKPDARPSSIASQSDPSAAVAVSLGREGQVYFNPYTGSITGEGNKTARAFFGFMTDLHRYLAMSGDERPWGRAVTGACNLMFLCLAITGTLIWFPKKLSRQHLRPRTWFRSGLAGKARDFNWHTTIGFWSSLVLVVLTVTAAVISYQWAGNLVYTLTGNEVPRQQNQPSQNPASQAQQPFTVPANINELWARAEENVPRWKSISLRLPVAKEANFTIDEGTAINLFGRASLSLDATTTEIARWEPYAQKNAAVQIRSWMRFLHTGESLGIAGQIIGFLACIGGSFLVFTGLSLAFRRLKSWVQDRQKAQPEAIPAIHATARSVIEQT